MDFSLPSCPIEKLEGETSTAYSALWVFLEMGPIRTVQLVADHLQSLRANRKLSDRKDSDTRTRNGRLERYANDHRWHERADLYDDWLRRCHVNAKLDGQKETFEALVRPFREGYELKVEVEKRLLKQIQLNAISPEERESSGLADPFLSVRAVSELSGAFQRVTLAGRSIIEDALRFHGLDEIAKKIGAETAKNDKH
jgi:hypothetical protein